MVALFPTTRKRPFPSQGSRGLYVFDHLVVKGAFGESSPFLYFKAKDHALVEHEQDIYLVRFVGVGPNFGEAMCRFLTCIQVSNTLHFVPCPLMGQARVLPCQLLARCTVISRKTSKFTYLTGAAADLFIERKVSLYGTVDWQNFD